MRTSWSGARAHAAGALVTMRAPTLGRAKRPAAEVQLERLRHRNVRLDAELAKPISALDAMGNCTPPWRVSRERGHRLGVDKMTTAACAELQPPVGVSRSCALTGRSRATRYGRLAGPLHPPPRPRPTPPILRATYAAIAHDDAWETEARDGRA
jgi:hypothetical protein